MAQMTQAVCSDEEDPPALQPFMEVMDDLLEVLQEKYPNGSKGFDDEQFSKVMKLVVMALAGAGTILLGDDPNMQKLKNIIAAPDFIEVLSKHRKYIEDIF